MDLVILVRTLFEWVVVNNEDGSVKDFSSDDAITIEILVKEEDMGRLIGKNGKIINVRNKNDIIYLMCQIRL